MGSLWGIIQGGVYPDLRKRSVEEVAPLGFDGFGIGGLSLGMPKAASQEVTQLVVRLLALRQPVARDLREIFSALKIGSDLERIGDYAANVAKRSIALSQTPAVRPVYALPRMAHLAQELIKDVLDSYVQRDADKAYSVWIRDAELDEMYSSLFRELLTYMMEDPRSISPCTHLLFMAKNIERIGDHATNIAENLYYLVNGSPIEEVRPKGDVSSLEVVMPGHSAQ